MVAGIEAQHEAAMLASGKLVGFIPTRDYDKARAFYEGKLGFKFISLDQFALVVNVGGHMIRITIDNSTRRQFKLYRCHLGCLFCG